MGAVVGSVKDPGTNHVHRALTSRIAILMVVVVAVLATSTAGLQIVGMVADGAAALPPIDVVPRFEMVATSVPYKPAAITTGPDGNLWFASDSKIGRVTPGGEMDTFTDPGISNAKAIITGPDGNLWFSSHSGFGRVNPAGVITMFEAGEAIQASDMVVDPDGRMWFNNVTTNKIGYITTSGAITQFAATHPGDISGTSAMVFGPDARLWYTNFSNSSIGVLDPATGTTQAFSDTGIKYPGAITVDRVGQIWFANTGPTIGRITTSGAVTSFTASGFSNIRDMTPGPDGNVWFTHGLNSSIGRIRPTGDISTFASTTPHGAFSKPAGITTGPDGNLWFTDDGASPKVGQGVMAGTYFHAMAPKRLIDPRPNTKVGPYTTPWSPGEVRKFAVGGKLGVPEDAKAVVLNVTVTDVTAPGGTFISVYPAGTIRPSSSSLNAARLTTVANAVTVKLGVGEGADAKISVYNEAGKANVIVDVVGWYDSYPGDRFNTMTPKRLIDPRPDTKVGPYSTPWSAGEVRAIQVAGPAASGFVVPQSASAVVLNVTGTDVTGPLGTFVSIYPTGGSRPSTSSLNVGRNETAANQVTAALSPDGKISVYNEAGKANVIIDVSGYYLAGTGDEFFPVAPYRVIDSRPATRVGPWATPWGPGSARELAMTGAGQVPAWASALSMNVTATDVDSPVGTFISVYPFGPRPDASNLNVSRYQTRANAVITRAGVAGTVVFYNAQGNANIIVDVNGYFG